MLIMLKKINPQARVTALHGVFDQCVVLHAQSDAHVTGLQLHTELTNRYLMP